MTLAKTPREKLAAVRDWVENGIPDSLEVDPSGFLLGIASVTILGALDEIADHLPPERPRCTCPAGAYNPGNVHEPGCPHNEGEPA